MGIMLGDLNKWILRINCMYPEMNHKNFCTSRRSVQGQPTSNLQFFLWVHWNQPQILVYYQHFASETKILADVLSEEDSWSHLRRVWDSFQSHVGWNTTELKFQRKKLSVEPANWGLFILYSKRHLFYERHIIHLKSWLFKLIASVLS